MMTKLILAAAFAWISVLAISAVRNLRARRSVEAARQREIDADLTGTTFISPGLFTFRAVPIYVGSVKLGELRSSTINVEGGNATITGSMLWPYDGVSSDIVETTGTSTRPLKVSMMMAGKVRHCLGRFTAITITSDYHTGECVAHFTFVGGALVIDGPIVAPSNRPPGRLADMRAVSN